MYAVLNGSRVIDLKQQLPEQSRLIRIVQAVRERLILISRSEVGLIVSECQVVGQGKGLNITKCQVFYSKDELENKWQVLQAFASESTHSSKPYTML